MLAFPMYGYRSSFQEVAPSNLKMGVFFIDGDTDIKGKKALSWRWFDDRAKDVVLFQFFCD